MRFFRLIALLIFGVALSGNAIAAYNPEVTGLQFQSPGTVTGNPIFSGSVIFQDNISVTGTVTINGETITFPGVSANLLFKSGIFVNGDCLMASGTAGAIADAGAPCGSGGGGSGTVSAGTANELAYYASNGTTVSGITTANNGVLVTGASGIPAISTTLPSGLTIPSVILTSPNLGTPSVAVLTNATGLPISGGVSGLGTGVAAGLANAVTGSGGPVLATSPTISGLTVTGSFLASGLVTNSDLVNASTTVNGQTCTLGSTCTITASAGTITIGSTTIASGTTAYLLFNNGGTLGNEPVSGLSIAASQLTTGTISAPITFTNSDLILLGSGAGHTVFSSSNSSGTNYTVTVPPLSGTITLQGNSTTGSGNLVLATSPSISALTVTSSLNAIGLVTNSDLVNASTTVNGQTCTLGSTCSIATNLTVGSTPISSGTPGDIEFNNGGILGEKSITGSGSVVLASSPSISGLTVTSFLTATGLITNADLVNSSTTVNGQTCTLGLTCTITVSASSITVGSTAVNSGVSGDLLYINGSTLGNQAVSALSLAGSQITSGTVGSAFLPSATTLALGAVKPDGTSCFTTSGVLSCGGSVFNVVDFGADKTGGSSSSTAIAAAQAAGKNILFPCGTYLVTSPISIPSNGSVEGAAYGCVTINESGLSSSTVGMLDVATTANNTTVKNIICGSYSGGSCLWNHGGQTMNVDWLGVQGNMVACVLVDSVTGPTGGPVPPGSTDGGYDVQYHIGHLQCNAAVGNALSPFSAEIGVGVGLNGSHPVAGLYLDKPNIMNATVCGVDFIQASGVMITGPGELLGNNRDVCTDPASGQLVASVYISDVFADYATTGPNYDIETSGGLVQNFHVTNIWANASPKNGMLFSPGTGVITQVSVMGGNIGGGEDGVCIMGGDHYSFGGVQVNAGNASPGSYNGYALNGSGSTHIQITGGSSGQVAGQSATQHAGVWIGNASVGAGFCQQGTAGNPDYVAITGVDLTANVSAEIDNQITPTHYQPVGNL